MHPVARPRAKLTSLYLLALGLLAAGCTKVNLKPPTKGADPHVLPVSDYDPRASARDHALRVGNAEVGDVTGTPIYPPGLAAYGRVSDQDKWSYAFKIREGNNKLRAECAEQVGEVRYFGLGEIMLDLRCSCFEGETRVASLAVVSGKGEAVLRGDAHYAVQESREASDGSRSRAVLGYRFQAGDRAGAVDTTRKARAYLPKELPEPQRLPLTCLYAALLLHRPVK